MSKIIMPLHPFSTRTPFCPRFQEPAAFDADHPRQACGRRRPRAGVPGGAWRLKVLDPKMSSGFVLVSLQTPETKGGLSKKTDPHIFGTRTNTRTHDTSRKPAAGLFMGVIPSLITADRSRGSAARGLAGPLRAGLGDSGPHGCGGVPAERDQQAHRGRGGTEDAAEVFLWACRCLLVWCCCCCRCCCCSGCWLFIVALLLLLLLLLLLVLLLWVCAAFRTPPPPICFLDSAWGFGRGKRGCWGGGAGFAVACSPHPVSAACCAKPKPQGRSPGLPAFGRIPSATLGSPWKGQKVSPEEDHAVTTFTARKSVSLTFWLLGSMLHVCL